MEWGIRTMEHIMSELASAFTDRLMSCLEADEWCCKQLKELIQGVFDAGDGTGIGFRMKEFGETLAVCCGFSKGKPGDRGSKPGSRDRGDSSGGNSGASGTARGESSGGGSTPRGVCFVSGTLVATDSGPVAIQEIEVGIRVLTSDSGQQGSYSEVDSDTWCVVRLLMENPESTGNLIEMSALRSPEWIRAHRAAVGEVIQFHLPEWALSGRAIVLGIDPCPVIEDGPGRVVLTTLTHMSGNVHELEFADGEILSPTGRHRLFSESRREWVPAASLEIGEFVRTQAGAVEIVRLDRLSGVHRVFNIEVETDHCYYAGDNRVLSHNENPCAHEDPKGRAEAFNDAKRENGVPTSKQPDRTIKPDTPEGDDAGLRRGENVRQYEFTNEKGEKVIIREDAPKAYPDGGKQGGHFNSGPAGEKLKGHHYFE